MSKETRKKSILFPCVVTILVLLIFISGLQLLESTVFFKHQGVVDQSFESKTIVRDGISYFPRQDIKVLLILGIDDFGPVTENTMLHQAGAADMVTLVVFNETSKSVSLLVLNRDTMLEMPVLGIGGKEAGTYFGQLALSHTFGSGLKDSCENSKKTVSNFLYGLRIDYYLAMNMDAITILNDAVGGVTVNVVDDFSAIDSTISKGIVTLRGQQAINFVRTRQGLSDQLNISRMERHKEYMRGFVEALLEKRKDPSFVINTYDRVSDYIVTDCTVTVMNDLLTKYADYPISEVISPPGDNVMSDFYEFYVDSDALEEIILKLFYVPKQ